MARTLLQASTLVGLALLLSRLSGLIREQVLGAQLGLTAQMDAALLILTLPDLLVGLLLSGGFAAALVPALTRADKGARIELTSRVMGWAALAGLMLGMALFAAMPLVLSALAPATDVGQLTAFRAGFALSLVAMPIVAVIGVSSSYLNVAGKYSITALSVLAFNGFLATYFYIGIGGGAVNFAAFGAAVLVATLARFAVQASQMHGFTLRKPERGRTARFASGFASQFIQGVLGAALVVAMPIVFRSLYALGGAGDLAEFNFALRLFELPMGILIAPITIIFLPLLSKLNDPTNPVFAARAGLALRVAAVLGLTSALVGGLYAVPIVALLFGFGQMAGDGTAAIAETTQIMLIGLPFMALFQALSVALNATNRTGQVLGYSALALALALVLYVGLRLSGADTGLASRVGFVSFGMISSALGLYGVFGAIGHGSALRGVLGDLAIITLRTVAVALPFLLWAAPVDGSGFELWHLGALCALGLVLMAVNLPVLGELKRTRDVLSETK